MKALILNDYGIGANYATYVFQGIKTIETRMGRLFKYRGDLIICKGKTNSVGELRGMALCVVNIFDGRMMLKSDEEYAMIEWHPERRALLMKDWQYFNRHFEFTKHVITKDGSSHANYQGIFDVELPADVFLIPQPQIIGFVETQKVSPDLFSVNNDN